MNASVVLRVAAKAVIINREGRILLVREASTYKEGTGAGRYHMPGGRLDLGESFEHGLHREIKEETGLEVKPLFPIYVGEWRPVIRGRPHQIIAIFTVCKAKTTRIKLSDEHDGYEWILPKEAKNFDIMDPEPEVIKRYSKWPVVIDD